MEKWENLVKPKTVLSCFLELSLLIMKFLVNSFLFSELT
jgi:hypothetical protein